MAMPAPFSLAVYMEAVARRMKGDLPESYGYRADIELGVGFFTETNTGCNVLEKPVCIPHGEALMQGYTMLYSYCSKDGLKSLLEGQMPPILPATTKEPKDFPSLAAIADNFGQKDPQANTKNSEYCIAFRVPAELATQAETPGRDLWIIRFDQDKISPFLQAAKEGDAQKVAEGLKAGIKGTCVDETGVSALMMAAMQGSVDACKALLQHGADVNAAEPKSSRTALMFASQGGHLDTAKLLVETNADVSKVDTEGCTALMWAALANQAGVAAYLSSQGAKDAKNNEGQTAADIAAKMGHQATIAVLK